MNEYNVNINGFDVLISKQPFEVALCAPNNEDYNYLTPEQAETLANALLSAAMVAKQNKVKNEFNKKANR